MSFAFLPLYSGDYLRDTRALTPMRHGIYLLLLMQCWDQKGPLPLDEQDCAGIANCRSADEIDALRYILAKFFVRMEDGFYNIRMQKEIERAAVISLARSGAGRKGYEARAKQLLSNSQASASTPTPTLTPTPKPPSRQEVPTAPVGKADASGYQVPNCPYQAMLDAYHAACPSMPKLKILTAARTKHAQARWKQVCAQDKIDADKCLDWFRWFFAKAESSDFLTGRIGNSKGHTWRADFDWLMNADNFAKVIEGRYHGETA